MFASGFWGWKPSQKGAIGPLARSKTPRFGWRQGGGLMQVARGPNHLRRRALEKCPPFDGRKPKTAGGALKQRRDSMKQTNKRAGVPDAQKKKKRVSLGSQPSFRPRHADPDRFPSRTQLPGHCSGTRGPGPTCQPSGSQFQKAGSWPISC